MYDIYLGADTYKWIGKGDESWTDATNWADATTQASPALQAPGIADPVKIAGTSGSAPLTVSGGGSAASLGVSGKIVLSGGFTPGALSVGASSSKTDQYANTTVSYTAGTLGVGAGSSVQATTVKVLDGTATVSGAGAWFSASGAVTVGAPSNYASNSTINPSTQVTTYTSTSNPGAFGTLSIVAGAVFSAASTVAVASGSLSVAGTDATSGQQSTAAVGADLSLGIAPTLSSSGYPMGGSAGSLSVSGGAKVRVDGAITENNGSFGSNVSVSGQGSSLAATGGLTVYGNGGAAAGALTVDAGQTVASTTNASLSAYGVVVVDNGIVSETGGTLTLGGAITGTGSVEIGAGGTVALNGTAAASNAIAFAGAASTLEIGSNNDFGDGSSATTPYAVSSTLTGFATGDGILVDNTSITAAVYTSTGIDMGALTL